MIMIFLVCQYILTYATQNWKIITQRYRIGRKWVTLYTIMTLIAGVVLFTFITLYRYDVIFSMIVDTSRLFIN